MFTFGIFTTHLPYAALVLFYFFVIITGFTRKPTGTEFRTNEMQQSGVVICFTPEGFADNTISPEPEGQAEYTGNENTIQHLLPEKWLNFPITDQIFIDRPALNIHFNRPPPEA